MTKDQILSRCKVGVHTVDFHLYSKAFQADMVQMIYIPTINWKTGEKETRMNKLVTDYVTDCVNSFINLDSSSFMDKLKSDIYERFDIFIENTRCAEVADELILKHGLIEANRKFFKGESAESVFSNCNFHSVLYDNMSKSDLWFSVEIKLDWDIEHGLVVFFKNGEYVNLE